LNNKYQLVESNKGLEAGGPRPYRREVQTPAEHLRFVSKMEGRVG